LLELAVVERGQYRRRLADHDRVVFTGQLLGCVICERDAAGEAFALRCSDGIVGHYGCVRAARACGR
jgi:hypothetical protein